MNIYDTPLEKKMKNKELAFLDVNIKKGQYDFNIFRKNAITNVQVKTESCRDLVIQKGIFRGFIHRVFSICSKKHLNEEIDFLKKIFVQNGYLEKDLVKIIEEIKYKPDQQTTSAENNSTCNHNYATQSHPRIANQTVALPQIPRLLSKSKNGLQKTRI